MAKEKILIIEDNPMNMELFNDLLEAEGYLILQAVNGKDGVEMAKSEMPDLILLDYGLPDINGMEVIERLKRDPRTKDVVIIVCTASVMKQEREKVMDAGCKEFITKPIDTGKFIKTIAKFLQNSKRGGRNGRRKD